MQELPLSQDWQLQVRLLFEEREVWGPQLVWEPQLVFEYLRSRYERIAHFGSQLITASIHTLMIVLHSKISD